MRMTFGEAMSMLLKDKGISATTAAQDLGFKSRTAFFRILHDESRLPAIEKCFEDAKRSPLLALNEDQIDFLREAILVSKLGKTAYGINNALHGMVYPRAVDSNARTEIQIEESNEAHTLEALLEKLYECQEITVAIMGRCSKRMMDRLHRLTKEAPVRKIVHLFALDEEDAEDIKVFSEMSDILFSSLYSVYYLNETGVGLKNWWLRSGVILFSFKNKSGKKYAFQLTWLGKRRYLYTEDDQEKLKGFWNGLIRNVKDQMIPLKTETGKNEQMDIQHYIGFTRSYQRLEQNREIYTIKPDFPINCVPVEILAPPVIDAFSQVYPGDRRGFETQISKLYDIHKARVENLYQKRRVTHIVLNVEAMMRFARTGNRSDHFFSTRPYTPQERIQVLTLLRDQARDNPNFHIWMSKHPDIISDRELTVYDGYGVALVKGDTSWQLDGDHQEILLESKMLAQYFKSYFMNNILGKAVMTKEESVAMLEEMIRVVKCEALSTEN